MATNPAQPIDYTTREPHFAGDDISPAASLIHRFVQAKLYGHPIGAADRKGLLEAVEYAARREPAMLLQNHAVFDDKKYAYTAIQTAARTLANSAPHELFRHAALFANERYALRLLTAAAAEEPSAALRWAGEYAGSNCGKTVLTAAADADPASAIAHVEQYSTQPYARAIVARAVAKRPDLASEAADAYTIIANARAGSPALPQGSMAR